jgi:hypothetical protein
MRFDEVAGGKQEGVEWSLGGGFEDKAWDEQSFFFLKCCAAPGQHSK